MDFEDVEIGDRANIGTHTFTRDEIIAFAGRWDPQPFHLDDEAAEASQFGALCASGWHTACTWMRLNVEDGARRIGEAMAAGRPVPRIGPSPGLFDLKWLRPVYVGDTIAYSWTVTDKRASKSRPDWGLITYHAEGINQDGVTVISFNGRFFLGRRNTG